MMAWWNARRAAHCGERAGWHAGHGGHHGGPFGGHGGGGGEGEGFGVRRPLRFLAFKLDLSEAQVTELARVLNDLKTERAQAAVDDRRTTSALADAISEDAWDESKAAAAADVRVETAKHLKDAVVKALGRIHAILDPAQRAKLAYLIRTGTLSI
jgi:Spy/CpxP family protein refolding chaperone